MPLNTPSKSPKISPKAMPKSESGSKMILSALGIKDISDLRDLKNYVKNLRENRKKYESLKSTLSGLKINKEFLKDPTSNLEFEEHEEILNKLAKKV